MFLNELVVDTLLYEVLVYSAGASINTLSIVAVMIVIIKVVMMFMCDYKFQIMFSRHFCLKIST